MNKTTQTLSTSNLIKLISFFILLLVLNLNQSISRDKPTSNHKVTKTKRLKDLHRTLEKQLEEEKKIGKALDEHHKKVRKLSSEVDELSKEVDDYLDDQYPFMILNMILLGIAVLIVSVMIISYLIN